jgi:hypothetical protein
MVFVNSALAVQHGLNDVSRGCLVVAIAALGAHEDEFHAAGARRLATARSHLG